jgi:hypothetical protein
MAPRSETPPLPFWHLLAVTATVAMTIQLIIISYNMFTGYIQVAGPLNFVVRLLYGSLLSTLMGLLVTWPDYRIIGILNRFMPWNRKPLVRVPVQFLGAVVTGSAVGVFGTIMAYLINPYTDDLPHVILFNAMILSVINLLAMASLEAWIFFSEGRISRQKAEKLEHELLKSRFEVLKTQINPHFMFNSLNVLSELVYSDQAKAEEFIGEFANIYRYVLDTIEKPVVPVESELAFARSYLFLQQIRYGNTLRFNVALDASVMPLLIPSLSLQTVLENAIKHNIVDAVHPLEISITAGEGCLVIRNNIRKKMVSRPSTGLGQENLAQRYAMICREQPRFQLINGEYAVHLPLINPER